MIERRAWNPLLSILAFLGGYVAALTVQRSESGHALAVGAIQFFFLLSEAFPLFSADPPIWPLAWFLLTLVLVIPVTALGGRHCRPQSSRKAAIHA